MSVVTWWNRMNARYWVPFHWGGAERGWTVALTRPRFWRQQRREGNIQ
jgi:hypothetical protein